jgi:hypothetical protein
VTAPAATRSDEVLELSAAFYAERLWSSEAGSASRGWLAREDIDDTHLRAFGIGYAPGDHGALLEELRRRGYTDEEILGSGVASRSARGRIAVGLSSRIVFPIRDAGGHVIGFAGLATNPGPSWAEWVTSAETERFRRSTALFAIDLAAAAIAQDQQAIVFRDCRDAIRSHAEGERSAVAVIRTRLGAGHRDELARRMGVRPARLETAATATGRAQIVKPGADEIEEGTKSPPSADPTPLAAGAGVAAGTGVRPDPVRERTAPERFAINVARAALGIAVPVGWFAVLGPSGDEPGGPGTAFVGAVGAVAVTYIVLAIAAAAISGWNRSRSRARRMRTPWERGATEWQPLAWTYNFAEDVLVAASLISIVVCVLLFLTVGGFM